jgi:glycine/D-amino acid oxidase-like deaminating enzyme
VPVALLAPGEAQARVPPMIVSDVPATRFWPTDGFCDLSAVALGYDRAARRNGATIRTGVEATDIHVTHGRASGVMTADEKRYVDQDLDAAGAYAAVFARMADDRANLCGNGARPASVN